MINMQNIPTDELEHWLGQIKSEIKSRQYIPIQGYNYLVKKRKAKVFHLYKNGDTACQMYSGGGLKISRYEITDNIDGLRMCHICAKNGGRS